MPDLTKDEMDYIIKILTKEELRLTNAAIELTDSSIHVSDPIYASLGKYKTAIQKMKQCINNLDERK